MARLNMKAFGHYTAGGTVIGPYTSICQSDGGFEFRRGVVESSVEADHAASEASQVLHFRPGEHGAIVCNKKSARK